MTLIYNCFKYSNDDEICIERLILAIISIISFFYFCKSYKIIYSDRNQTLDSMDRIIFFFTLMQFLLISLFYLIGSNFFLFLTRLIRLYQEYFFFLEFSSLIYQEKCQKCLIIISKFIIIVSFILSVINSIIMERKSSIQSKNIFLMVLSGITAFISFMNLIHFKKISNIIIHNDELINENNKDKNKSTVLFFLIFIFFVSIVLLFGADLLKYECFKKTSNFCLYFYLTKNFYAKIFLKIFFQIIFYYLPGWAIYYVFFQRNKMFFHIFKQSEEEKRLSLFYDNSNTEKFLIEMNTQI